MLKLNIGLSRKIGEANYSSRGASVNLELEVEAGLASDPDGLRERARQLFRMARASVDEELNGGGQTTNGHPGNGNGRSNDRQATASQCRAIRAIADRQQFDLAAELRSRFGVECPGDLALGQASELIDAIKRQAHGTGSRR